MTRQNVQGLNVFSGVTSPIATLSSHALRDLEATLAVELDRAILYGKACYEYQHGCAIAIAPTANGALWTVTGQAQACGYVRTH